MADEEKPASKPKPGRKNKAVEELAARVGTLEASTQASYEDLAAQVEAMGKELAALSAKFPQGVTASRPRALRTGEVKAILAAKPATKFKALNHSRAINKKPGDVIDPRHHVRDVNHLVSLVQGGLQLQKI